MDPASTFCPPLACPARGQTGQGHLGLHARQEQRFLCTECRQTCTATNGTALDRLRPAAETVSLVVTLRAHGCPRQAIVGAVGEDERTVACWLARAGVQALARHTLTRPHGMSLVGTVYNFCPEHTSRRLAAPAAGTTLLPRTPAMAAEITAHGGTLRELRSFHGPPPRWSPPKPRGRPSRALKRLLERWCGEHG